MLWHIATDGDMLYEINVTLQKKLFGISLDVGMGIVQGPKGNHNSRY